VTHLVLADPADAGVHGPVEAVPADDDEIEPVLADIGVEGRGRLVRFDDLGPYPHRRRNPVTKSLGRHLGQDLSAALGCFLGNLVRGLASRLQLQHGEHDDFALDGVCKLRRCAKGLATVPRPVPAHQNSPEARQWPS